MPYGSHFLCSYLGTLVLLPRGGLPFFPTGPSDIATRNKITSTRANHIPPVIAFTSFLSATS